MATAYETLVKQIQKDLADYEALCQGADYHRPYNPAFGHYGFWLSQAVSDAAANLLGYTDNCDIDWLYQKAAENDDDIYELLGDYDTERFEEQIDGYLRYCEELAEQNWEKQLIAKLAEYGWSYLNKRRAQSTFSWYYRFERGEETLLVRYSDHARVHFARPSTVESHYELEFDDNMGYDLAKIDNLFSNLKIGEIK